MAGQSSAQYNYTYESDDEGRGIQQTLSTSMVSSKTAAAHTDKGVVDVGSYRNTNMTDHAI